MQLNVIFGSTSDEEKVLPGVIRATKEIEGLEVRVHYASADNTPDKVLDIVYDIKDEEDDNVAYISGAGMSNVLTGVVKTAATLNDIVIGIPINDSKTSGVSSFLSTSEKPPGNPVLTVGLDNSYAGLNIGYRFMKGEFKDVVLLYSPDMDMGPFVEPVEKTKKALEDIGLKYKVNTADKIGENDVVIQIFHPNVKKLVEVDKTLRSGNGIQIGVARDAYELYHMDCLKGTEATGFVGIGAYANAAQMAAQIVQDETALAKIKEKKEAKAASLCEHPGLLVANGEVRKLGGIENGKC